MTEKYFDSLSTPKRKRGRPLGTPGGGKYNCTTEPVRIPVKYKQDIVKIIRFWEERDALIEDWEERIKTAAEGSKNGLPSPRYDKAITLLEELKNLSFLED